MTASAQTPEPLSPSDTKVAELAPEQTSNPQLLESAWKKHDVFDQNASQAQQRFFFLRRLLTYLSILIVVLAVAQPVILNQVIVKELRSIETSPSRSEIRAEQLQALQDDINSLSLARLWNERKYRALAATNFFLILFPIVMTGLRAFSVKFDRGSSWVLLRGSAESLKMEIYYYRTRVKPYDQNRHQVLAEKLQMISERVKGSAVHQSALSPYEGEPPKRMELGLVIVLLSRPLMWLNRQIQRVWQFLFKVEEVLVNKIDNTGEQRYTDLDVQAYLRSRLEDQFDWYRGKAKLYNRRYQIFQSSVYIFGGLGTFLAATGLQNWVAVTAALAGAFVTYLEYRRIEATLVGYNQAADALYDIRAWWYSLPDTAKADPKNFEKLVINTEETIRSEHNSWLQDMQDRLANLYESTSERSKSETDLASPSPSPAAEPQGKPKDNEADQGNDEGHTSQL
ncbi:MAG: DUF4231 domain-containing protein [Leptolyngbyaceae cyanobacterium SM2_5_2]|nr:DUF4231 domain-containing protein [Leptolyngbyaceae cyanobacterium SM2_5_2]